MRKIKKVKEKYQTNNNKDKKKIIYRSSKSRKNCKNAKL